MQGREVESSRRTRGDWPIINLIFGLRWLIGNCLGPAGAQLPDTQTPAYVLCRVTVFIYHNYHGSITGAVRMKASCLKKLKWLLNVDTDTRETLRARESSSRAYEDAGIRCADRGLPGGRTLGHARMRARGIDVDRLVGGGQVVVQRQVLARLHGGRAQVDGHVHPPLRGGRVESRWQSHNLSERSRRRVGDLGAWLTRRQRR